MAWDPDPQPVRRQPSNTNRLRKGRLPVRPAYIIVVAVIVIFSVKFMQKTWEAHRLAGQVAVAQQQVAALSQANADVQAQIRSYRTKAAIEDAARQLGFVRRGDHPVIVSGVTYEPAYRAAPRVAIRPAPPLPVWRQWWNLFFGHG